MKLDTLITECTAYDYKVTLEEKKPKSWLKCVSAFANGSGGSLFFGVDNGGFVVVTFIRPSKDVPQDVPQDVPEEGNLDAWIEEQIFQNPNITTKELAKLSGFVSKTIKRHIAKMPHITYVGSGYSGHWEITKE